MPQANKRRRSHVRAVRYAQNALRASICALLIVQLVGCGTIMYPERKGQKAGRIDAGVAILDGLGLLLLIIPGVIAFAVDFNNGTIYLPGTSRSSLDLRNPRPVKFDPKHRSLALLERTIKEETGRDVRLDDRHVQVSKLGSIDDLKGRARD
jgi:hypothetical protein